MNRLARDAFATLAFFAMLLGAGLVAGAGFSGPAGDIQASGGSAANSNFATSAGTAANANTATYATTAGNANNANTATNATNVIAGGNVVTNALTANTLALSTPLLSAMMPTSGAGSGTVTSVSLTVPGVLFSVSGSPITASGTLAFALLSQSPNTLFAGPSGGASGVPSWRLLTAGDIPSTLGATTFSGNLTMASGKTHNWALGTTLGETANGTLQVLNSGATGGGIQFGPSGPILSYVSGTLLNLGANLNSSGIYISTASAPTVAYRVGSINYGLGSPTSTSIGLYSGNSSSPSLSLDSNQNAVFGGNVTIGGGGKVVFPFGTWLTETSAGVFNVTNAGAGSPARIAPNSFGGAANNTVVFNTYNATGYGLGFADTTHLNLYTNNTSALSIDSSQNVTLANNLTVSGSLISPLANAYYVNASGSPGAGRTATLYGVGGTFYVATNSVSPTTALSIDASQNTTLFGNLTIPTASGYLFSGALGLFDTGGVVRVRNSGNTADASIGGAAFVQETVDGACRICNPAGNLGVALGSGGTVAVVVPNGGVTFDPNGAISGNRGKVVSITAATYTIVTADSGKHFNNTGAGATVAFTLPTPADGLNNCFTTTAAQTITLTTPTGAIVGGPFTSGVTRTVNAQFVHFCVEAQSGNYQITQLVGTIAS